MEVLFVVVPLAVLMAGAFAAAFIWSVHGGQYDDLETPGYRAIFDDVEQSPPKAGGNLRRVQKK